MRAHTKTALIRIKGTTYATLGMDKFKCLTWIRNHPAVTAEEISAGTSVPLRSARVYAYELECEKIITAAQHVEHGHLCQRYSCLESFEHLNEFHQL